MEKAKETGTDQELMRSMKVSKAVAAMAIPRIALLGILILSCAIPFVEVTMKEPMEVSQQLLTWEELLLMANLNPIYIIMSERISGKSIRGYLRHFFTGSKIKFWHPQCIR